MSPVSCFHCVLLSLLASGFFLRGTKAIECPSGWLLYSTFCYGVFGTRVSWKDAEEDCKEYGRRAHLASILTQAQGDLISSHLQLTENEEDLPIGIWIGLHDPNKKGFWKWVDLSILSYLPWSNEEVVPQPGTPSKGGCVYLSSKTDYTKWHIAPCSEKMKYMCRKLFI